MRRAASPTPRRKWRRHVIALLALTAAPLNASANDTFNAVYQAYVGGLNAVELRSQFTLTPRDYRISINSRTLGMARLFASGQQENRADGLWHNGAPQPRNFHVDGLWRGNARRAHIAFLGSGPEIRDLEPPERGRHPVPESDRLGTLDPLSVLAALSRLVAQTGNCDGETRVYDGRKLESGTTRTIGWETLPPSTATIFSGRALRCEVVLKLVGGFLKDRESAAQQAPRLGTAWIAPPTPGAPPLPVMFKLQVSWLGEATVFLTEFAPGPTRPAP